MLFVKVMSFVGVKCSSMTDVSNEKFCQYKSLANRGSLYSELLWFRDFWWGAQWVKYPGSIIIGLSSEFKVSIRFISEDSSSELTKWTLKAGFSEVWKSLMFAQQSEKVFMISTLTVFLFWSKNLASFFISSIKFHSSSLSSFIFTNGFSKALFLGMFVNLFLYYLQLLLFWMSISSSTKSLLQNKSSSNNSGSLLDVCFIKCMFGIAECLIFALLREIFCF